MRTYTDILIDDLASVRPYILEQNDVQYNLNVTRCIVTWEGEEPQFVTDLNCIHRTHSEALTYYGNHANGWSEEGPAV